jgi:hypothetical protein
MERGFESVRLQECRQHAEQAQRAAEQARDPSTKGVFRGIAQGWRCLAQEEEQKRS